MKRVLMLTFVPVLVAMALPLVSQAAPIELEASADIWIRELSPSGTFENDLISVWASHSAEDAGTRRYGLVEFDLSSLAGLTLDSAVLQLYSLTGGSQATLPVKQRAFVIDSAGTALASLNWNLYMAEKDAGKTMLEGLGRYDLGVINDLPELQNANVGTTATAADLALLQSEIDGDGILSLVLIADEDGNDYRRDWGDGANAAGPGYQASTPALLQVTIPEPASVCLLAIALVIAPRRRTI